MVIVDQCATLANRKTRTNSYYREDGNFVASNILSPIAKCKPKKMPPKLLFLQIKLFPLPPQCCRVNAQGAGCLVEIFRNSQHFNDVLALHLLQ